VIIPRLEDKLLYEEATILAEEERIRDLEEKEQLLIEELE
jgi:hypothetical protein